jgi:hypothetical protein
LIFGEGFGGDGEKGLSVFSRDDDPGRLEGGRDGRESSICQHRQRTVVGEGRGEFVFIFFFLSVVLREDWQDDEEKEWDKSKLAPPGGVK